MSASLLTVVLQLIAQVVTEAPTVIADIEALLSAAKGQAPAAPQPPIQPVVDAEMAPALSALEAPITVAKS